MKKYKYDIKLGHYIPLFEGEVVNQGEQNTQNQESQQSEQAKASLTNLETEEVVQLRAEKNNKLSNIQKTIDQKNSVLVQCQEKVANASNEEQIDQSQLNLLQKTLLQAQKDLLDAKMEYAKVSNEMDVRIIQQQLKLVESKIYYQPVFPEKYKRLNESNIQNAKIHFSSLIDNDVQGIISGMVDFKKAFKDSELLYGKDKDGYFAVCVDQADFNKLVKTLEDAGYHRDDIMAVCLPQIFDRSNLTK